MASLNNNSKDISLKRNKPNFHHSEIEWLYEHGLYIEGEKLEKILSLPRETVIKDLELIIKDSIDHCAYFEQEFEKLGWDESRTSFVIHAIYLLGELKASESFKVICNCLSQEEEYLDVHIGDFLTGMLWEPIYKMCPTNFEAFKQFLFQPTSNPFPKSNIFEVLEQLILHQPKYKQEVVDWFSDVMSSIINDGIEILNKDKDLIALLVISSAETRAKELIPKIEKIFELDYVEDNFILDIEEVWEVFDDNYIQPRKIEVLSIKERYKKITETWASYVDPEAFEREERLFEETFSDDSLNPFDPDDPFGFYPESVVKSIDSHKIGRNDPCPCGSGKKYKKCCL